MNSRETNARLLKALEEMSAVYEDDASSGRHIIAGEKEKEPPLSFARKVTGWLTLLAWGMVVVMLITGAGDYDVFFPFLLGLLGAYAFLSVPKFLANKKRGDALVSTLAGGLCVMLALGMFVMNSLGS